jgi:hypothetical protein
MTGVTVPYSVGPFGKIFKLVVCMYTFLHISNMTKGCFVFERNLSRSSLTGVRLSCGEFLYARIIISQHLLLEYSYASSGGCQ